MKKIKFILLAAFFFLLSCATHYRWKIKLEIPGESALDLKPFQQIVITNFLIKKETRDIDLSKEIMDYFNFEIGQKYEGEISLKDISLKDEQVFEQDNFWKHLQDDAKKTLFFTGSAHYSEEVRKAILEKTRRRQYDEPFTSEKKLAERKFYTLQLDLYLIEAESGNPVYERSFKETQGYDNPNQTAYFAFFDLIQKVKEKFFRHLLGGERTEERYLIIE
ncbi:MAG: hypothetical protein ACLFVG_01055 [Candidatus Aminicenantes bacterium]